MPAAKRKTKKATQSEFITSPSFYGMSDARRANHPALSLQKEAFGWDLYLARTRNGVVVTAGCRWLDLKDEAVAHWEYQRDENVFATMSTVRRAKSMLALLPTLKRRARRLGWI